MTNSKLRSITCTLVLLLSAALLTTCGDDSSSSNDDLGVLADMADVLTQAEIDFLSANAAVFASADSMRPHIDDALQLNTQWRASTAAPNSCLPQGTGGKLYSFNGESYSGQTDAVVPEYTARFQLYAVSGSGQPQIGQVIGYVDYTCADLGAPVTEVQVFNIIGLVASSTHSRQSGVVSCAFRTADGSRTLQSLGSFSPESVLDLRFILTDELQAKYQFPLESAAVRRVRAEWGSAPAIVWGLTVTIDVDETGAVADSGYALYHPNGQSLEYDIASCISAGTVSAPVFSPPSTSCFDAGDHMNITQSQLSAVSDSYQSLHELWSRAAILFDICRSLVPE